MSVNQVTDANGNVYNLVPAAGAVSALPVSVAAALSGAAAFASARAGETSTHLGAAVGAVAAPTLASYAVDLATAVASGNLLGIVANALPLAAGLFGVAAAILSPDKKRVSDDQIKAAVAALSAEQLVSLLDQHAGVNAGSAGGNLVASAGAGGGVGQSAVAVAVPTVAAGIVQG